MSSFLQGVLLGFGVAVPIGPLNILIMSYAFTSYSKALCLGLGAMSTDVFYLILLSFGVLHLLNTPITLKIVAIFGSLFLIYMAFGLIKDANKDIKAKSNLKSKGYLNTYFKGCFLNLTNPYVIIFWFSMAAIITSANNLSLTLFGLIVGILSWILVFPLIIYKSKNFISKKIMRALAYFSAFVLLFFALNLLYQHFFKEIL